MSSKDNQQQQQFIAGQNLYKSHKSLAFVHSDETLEMFQEAQGHEKKAKPYLILRMAIYFYENSLKDQKKKIIPYGAQNIPDEFYLQAIKWYEEEFVPDVIKTLKEKSPKQADKVINETGWIFLLDNIRWTMEYQSQRDLNPYARREYGETIHASLKIPSIKYEPKKSSSIPEVESSDPAEENVNNE